MMMGGYFYNNFDTLTFIVMFFYTKGEKEDKPDICFSDFNSSFEIVYVIQTFVGLLIVC